MCYSSRESTPPSQQPSALAEAAATPSHGAVLPRHVWELAEALRAQQGLSLDEVSFNLRARGHPDDVIEHVARLQGRLVVEGG